MTAQKESVSPGLDEPGTLHAGVPLEGQFIDACNAVGEFIEYWGFKATHGRVWLLLAIHRQPLAQKELGRMLELSRGTISTVVSDLVEHGLIEPVSDHRNAPYRAMIEFWPTIANVLKNREAGLIRRAHASLNALLLDLENHEAAEDIYDLERIRGLVKLSEMAQRFLQLLINVPLPSHTDRMTGWFSTVGRIAQKLRKGLSPSGD